MGSNPVRAWIFSGLISTTSSVVFIAARIAYICFFTAVHIYDFHIFPIIIHYLGRFIWIQYDNQLPVGLLAHLEAALHRTGLNFFQVLF